MGAPSNLGSGPARPPVTEPAVPPTTDGVVALRAPRPGDADLLIAGRDEEWRRWLGPGSDDPRPTACVEAGGEVVGWVDYDVDRSWLEPGEVNVGYNIFAGHRGRGLATKALQLLMHHLAVRTPHRVATLLIHPENAASLALASRARFPRVADLDGNPYFKRPVPPLTYGDGVVVLRRPEDADLEEDLEAKDDEQMRWLWPPEHRAAWMRATTAERRAHAARGLRERREAFGTGPKWTFSVDAPHAGYVAYVDCDLANEHVPHGEANISYSAHPAHRGKGYVSRGVRLALCFLRDHTGCREAHIVVDADNNASLRVAQAVGAEERDRWVNDAGRTMVRHVIGV